MSDLLRFESKVIHLVWTDCIAFDYPPTVNGYAFFHLQGKTETAHRAAWLLAGLVIPVGYDLDHLCRQRWCVNIRHLEPVTHKVNRARGVQRTNDELCRKGLHPWIPENITVEKRGNSVCTPCRAEYRANYYQENRK